MYFDTFNMNRTLGTYYNIQKWTEHHFTGLADLLFILQCYVTFVLPYFDGYRIVWVVHLVSDMSDHIFHKFRLVDKASTIPCWHSPSENITKQFNQTTTIKKHQKMIQCVHRDLSYYPIWQQQICEIVGRLWMWKQKYILDKKLNTSTKLWSLNLLKLPNTEVTEYWNVIGGQNVLGSTVSSCTFGDSHSWGQLHLRKVLQHRQHQPESEHHVQQTVLSTAGHLKRKGNKNK